MEIPAQPIRHTNENVHPSGYARILIMLLQLKEKAFRILLKVKNIGRQPDMDEYEQRKLTVFNQLNFLQLIASLLIPATWLLNAGSIPQGAWFAICLPAIVSVFTFYMNKKGRYELAALCYFILYPFATCFIYLYGMNPGTTLFFVLYGILSVFFLKDTGYMIFSLCFSMISYFLLAVVIRHFPYELHSMSYPLYFFNQIIAILFIFYGLYLIKKENTIYQSRIVSKNMALHEKNTEIQQQSAQITEHTARLEKQTDEMRELDTLKNRLFSIIGHDLRAPVYALRNLFNTMHTTSMSAREIKGIIPDVQNDLNYVVGLMDNLLHWAKAQMRASTVIPQKIDLQKSIQEVISLLQLQAKAKHICITQQTPPEVYCLADKDMINLVIRNLVSNAIKFTPEKGNIDIGVNDHHSFAEVYIKDSGAGMEPEAIQKIAEKIFYTTNGTASEQGTGLGLMLCREFLERNDSVLHIESEPGQGSIFSFSLKKSA